MFCQQRSSAVNANPALRISRHWRSRQSPERIDKENSNRDDLGLLGTQCLPQAPAQRAHETTGLRYWMLRVLEECEHVSADFASDPVHDLRVSLRRCRSLADGLMALDPDPNWKAMKKAGKRLFQRLGALRDIQVMMEWVEKLAPTAHPSGRGRTLRLRSGAGSPALPAFTPSPKFTPDSRTAGDPAAQALLKSSPSRARTKARSPRRPRRVRPQAMASMEQISSRARRPLPPGQPALQTSRSRALGPQPANSTIAPSAIAPRSHFTLSASASSVSATSSRTSCPLEHKAWSNDLKEMQDLLGDVHDLDVLWSTAVSCHIFPGRRFAAALARTNPLRAHQAHRPLPQEDDRPRFSLAGLARRTAPRQADSELLPRAA